VGWNEYQRNDIILDEALTDNDHMPEISQELMDHIEGEIEKSSKAYFDTTLNFIKWNTAIAVAVILWFGNYVINTTKNLSPIQWVFVIISLIFLTGTIVYSIKIFYSVSKYFNQYWILCSRWRESVLSVWNPPSANQPRPQNNVVTDLINHHQTLPTKAKNFDTALILQMSMLCIGIGSFVVFIVLTKLLPTT
jgi:hypothetical protein